MKWTFAPALLALACSTAPFGDQHATFAFPEGTEEDGSGGGDSEEGDTASADDGDGGESTSVPNPTVDPDGGNDDDAPSDTGEADDTNADADSGGPTTNAEEGSSEGDGEGEGEAEDDGEVEGSEGPDPVDCVDDDLGGALGSAVASGSTVGAVDKIAIGCASGGGADEVLLWTAPAAGTYTFDLSGSGYDTALAIIEPDCDGAELACNDDADDATSELTLDLAADEQVFVVIDGYDGATGSYVLDITVAGPPDFTCADGGDLGSAIGLVASGSTVGAADDWGASCQPNDGPDVAFVWTAPSDDVYTFSLADSDYDTVLTVQSHCGGEELDCDDDGAPVGLQSELTAALAAGETVLVVIDGYDGGTGTYALTIE